jgi:3-hydroxyacyl-CoA dehydrogenase/enoyl-CoA hydratase/carnithine racemase
VSEAAYTEVVTHAKVREVELPLGAGTMALITLDNGHDHTKPNTLGPQTLASIDAAIDAALALPGVAAIGITGKPFWVAAGADLKGVQVITDREQALEVARVGHRVLGRLGDSAVPSFAFLNGAALGGGLEIALNSTYRTASRAAGALALPEVAIGLLPGWGGNWLVPNLVGADNAVTVIVDKPLNNKVMKADEAAALGLVDAVFDGADFLAQSLLWAAKVLRGDETVARPEIDRSEQTWAAAVARARGIAAGKGRGTYPNADKAIDLLDAARTTTKAEGFALEDEALADLIMSDTTRANLYAFDLVQRRAKKPAGAPDRGLARKVEKVGVVGAGLMASQLALLFARQMKVPVVITDLDQERVDKGVAYVHGEVDKLVGKGRMDADTSNRVKALVTGTTDKALFSDADFVIEAVFEKMEVKQQVFGELESFVKPECVLATNTSSLSVAEMAKDLQYPERVVGFHFFTPVALMPTLEIAPTDRTDDATLATAFAVGKAIKKNCVWSKDTTAFIVNRLLMRGLGEAITTVDEGTPFQVADEGVVKAGFPLGAFILIAMTGPGVALHTAESLIEAFPDRFTASPGFAALVAAGKPAIYQWDDAGNPSVDPEVAALWPQGDSPSTADEVATRIKQAMADESRHMLDEGVVQAPQDIDLAMIGGAGLPLPYGGLLPLLDREGISQRVTGQRFLPPGVASVPPAS